MSISWGCPPTEDFLKLIEKSSGYSPLSEVGYGKLFIVEKRLYVKYSDDVQILVDKRLIEELDVDITDRDDGKALVWSSADGKHIYKTAGKEYYDDLLDVDASGKSDGYVPKWDASTNKYVVSSVSFAGTTAPGYKYVFNADSLIYPFDSAEWPVANTAYAESMDGVLIRRFEAGSDEGVGFLVRTNGSGTSMKINFLCKSTVADTTDNALFDLHYREFPDGGSKGTWNSYSLSGLSFGDTNLHYYGWTVGYSDLGLNAGSYYQFELVRKGASDNMDGDVIVYQVNVEFV